MSLDDDELCNIPRVSWDVLYMEIVRYVYNGQYINNNKILNDKLSSMGSYVGFNLLKLLIRNRVCFIYIYIYILYLYIFFI